MAVLERGSLLVEKAERVRSADEQDERVTVEPHRPTVHDGGGPRLSTTAQLADVHALARDVHAAVIAADGRTGPAYGVPAGAPYGVSPPPAAARCPSRRPSAVVGPADRAPDGWYPVGDRPPGRASPARHVRAGSDRPVAASTGGSECAMQPRPGTPRRGAPARERGVILRSGRVHRASRSGILAPPIRSQGTIARDDVSVDVSAGACFRVVDPALAVVAIENVDTAIDQIAQTTLRAVVGRHTLDETLADVMAAHPLALQLRNLQTLVEIAVDQNSTVIFPAPLMSTIQGSSTSWRASPRPPYRSRRTARRADDRRREGDRR